MISEGYKSAYRQGYSDAMRDFRKKSNTDVLDKIKLEIELKEKTLSDKYGQMKYGIWTDDIVAIINKYKAENEE